MKKVIALLLTSILCVSFVGCKSEEVVLEDEITNEESDSLTIDRGDASAIVHIDADIDLVLYLDNNKVVIREQAIDDAGGIICDNVETEGLVYEDALRTILDEAVKLEIIRDGVTFIADISYTEGMDDMVESTTAIMEEYSTHFPWNGHDISAEPF